MPSVTTALPLLRWLRSYRRTDAGADLLAGAITAVLLVPQAMAYAVVAGLPPQVGLYASVLPSLAYALFGTSPYLGVGPVAVNALMVASALAVVGHGDPAEQIVNAQVLAAISALTLLGLGALRAGAFMSFLSRPVLNGFTSGAALLIVLTQLPALLGLSAGSGPLLHEVLPAVWRALPMVDWPTLTLAMASIGLLILGGRPLRGLLGHLPLSSLQADLLTRLTPLLVLAVASVAAAAGDLAMRGVAVVGVIPLACRRRRSLSCAPRPGWNCWRPAC